MPNRYGTLVTLRAFLGTRLADALILLDSDTETDDVYEQAREDSDTEIDTALAKIFVVPFAAMPDTPRMVQKLSNYLTTVELFTKRHPTDEGRAAYQERVDSMLARLLRGEYDIPEAAKVAVGKGRTGITHRAGSSPKFSGYDPRDPSRGRMDNW